MREAQLWTLIREKLTGHLVRIENLAGSGQPDVNACLKGSEVWIELKMVKGNYIIFRSSQIAFFSRRAAVQGKVMVLARKEDNLILFRAEDVLSVADLLEPVKDGSVKIHWTKIPNPVVFSKPWQWEKIADLIYGF